MSKDLKSFWSRFQDGVEVAVAATDSEKLLGVREGFLRYFHDGLERPVPVRVVPQPDAPDVSDLALSDEETLELARSRARCLYDSFGDAYPFYVGAEGGLHSLEIEGVGHHFVRSWAVIVGVAGEAWGGSGSVQIPSALIEGLEGQQIPYAVPGTRRAGGLLGSLTGRLETPRTAVAAATFHALATMFYGILETRPVRRRRV